MHSTRRFSVSTHTVGREMMNSSLQTVLRHVALASKGLLLLLYCYVGTYVLLMTACIPCQDIEECIRYGSTSRFARVRYLPGAFTVPVYTATPENEAFMPVDFVNHRIAKAMGWRNSNARMEYSPLSE